VPSDPAPLDPDRRRRRPRGAARARRERRGGAESGGHLGPPSSKAIRSPRRRAWHQIN